MSFSDAEWLARAKGGAPPATVKAMTYLRDWGSFSRPFAVSADDGREYMLKSPFLSPVHARAAITDHVVARLGTRMKMAVGFPMLVEVTQELIDLTPKLRGMVPGLFHATRMIPGCGDRQGFAEFHRPDNRPRFADFAILYGLTAASDHQWIYEDKDPKAVFSVDHGHFFGQNGPSWTADTLPNVKAPEPDMSICSQCALTSVELRSPLERLAKVSDDDIAEVVRPVPEAWGFLDKERVGVCRFLSSRRTLMVAGKV